MKASVSDKKADKPRVADSEPAKAITGSQDHTRKRLIIAGGLITLCLISLGYTANQYSHNNKTTHSANPVTYTQYVCKDDLVKQATAAINTTNLKNLQAVTDVIKTKPHYDKDPVCMYIVSSYYVMGGDLQNAKKAVSQYEVLVRAEPKSTSGVSFDEQKLKALKSSVDSLQKQADSTSKNSVYGPGYKAAADQAYKDANKPKATP